MINIGVWILISFQLKNEKRKSTLAEYSGKTFEEKKWGKKILEIFYTDFKNDARKGPLLEEMKYWKDVVNKFVQ